MMNNKTISKWFSMLLLMLVAGITGAAAQSLSIRDFSIKAGESKTVAITLTADDDIYGVQTDLELCEGLSLEKLELVSTEEGLMLYHNTLNSGKIRMSLLSLAGNAISAGNIINLELKAADNFKGGKITLSNSRLTTSTAGDEEKVSDSEATVMLEVDLNAPMDVTDIYLTNADFEGSYSEYTRPRDDGNNARAIYQPEGWTISYTAGDPNDISSMNSNCLQWSNFENLSQPTAGGNNTYWMRLRFGANTNLTLSQTVSLPMGSYRLSADAFKGNDETGVAVISAADKSVTVDYRNKWANYSIVFTLTETTPVTISFSFEGKATDARVGVDNFKLEYITQGVDDLNMDWTSMIVNAGFELGSPSHSDNSITTPYGYSISTQVDGWEDGKIVTDDYTEGSKAYNLWAGTVNKADIYQTYTLPVGKYTLSADLKSDNLEGQHGVYAMIGEDIFKSTFLTESGNWQTLSKVFYVTEESPVQLGASSNAWFKIDNFQLKYHGAIQNTPYSITPTVATAVTNDKWYAVNISATGDYRIISSVANMVYYTQEGYKIPSDITTSVNLTADEMRLIGLTKGTLYVRAIEDANLTIQPNAYVYSVGNGTTSVADGEYTQSNTMTVTFADATTNDPDGALTILDDSKILVNDAVVPATIEGNVLTVTLASPIATSTDYVVSIEAGAVGYNADNANAAISLTAKTPAVFDGTYFIATTDGTQFISRGGDSNTEAVLDKYGIAVNFSTDANNVTHIQFVDNDKNLFGGSSSIYTDKNESDLGNNAARARWTVVSVDGGYSLYCDTWSKYIKAGTGAESGVAAATYDDNPYTWVLEAPTAHQTKIAAYKDANAEAVATDAGLTGITTVDGLIDYLASESVVEEDVTPKDAISTFTENYQGFGDVFKQEMTGLPRGLYKVTLHAFQRIRDNETTYSYHKNQPGVDNPTAYIYANDQKIQLPSVMSEPSTTAYSSQNFEAESGVNYPDGDVSAGDAFSAGKYTVDVYVYVDDGNLNVGVYSPAKYTSYNWIGYRDLQLTCYKANLVYTDLNTAVTTASSHIGFEDGEYAPYNNVASMTALATAKALDTSRDALNQTEIDNAKTALNAATWTANIGEVNAIYDGDFDAAKDNVASNTLPTGWHGSDSHYSDGYWCRYVYSDGSSNAGLTHFENGSAMMSKSTPRYGLDDGYTMPLKANTYYTISFDFAGWNSELVTTVVITDGEGEQVTVTPSQTATSANAGQTNTGDWKSYTGVFKTNAAGNYVLKFDKKEHDGNGGQVAYGAIKLFKASSADMKITDAQWATFCAPFDVEIPDGVTAYIVEDANENKELQMKEVTGTTIEANTPVLLYSDNPVSETFYGKAVEETPKAGWLVGTYKQIDAPVGSYVLQNHKGNVAFYKVYESPIPPVPANRAYLSVPSSEESRVFYLNGEATAIKAIEALTVGDAEIYDVNGRRQVKLQKGVNIIRTKDGRTNKVMVK